jgi:hypothetical protein
MSGFFFAIFLSLNLFAQDSVAFLRNFDTKVYSMKNKGIKDVVLEIENEKFTSQLNARQIFGKLNSVIVRVYWTSQPERIALDVIGLPEGFREIREEIKLAVIPALEAAFPPSVEQRFPGYKFSQGAREREIMAQDLSGLAAIPSYVLKFNESGVLSEIVANKPVGTTSILTKYVKEGFADGKQVLTEQITQIIENGAEISINRKLSYQKHEGISVIKNLKIETKQKNLNDPKKVFSEAEDFRFSNFRINQGDALKYFLGQDALDKK